MNPEEIRAAIEYLDACLAGIAERGESAEQESFDDGLTERARLVELLERHSRIAATAARPERLETTDPLAQPDSVRDDRDVWDLDAVERAMFRDTPAAGGAELRSRAVDAVERVAGVNDTSKERITQLLDWLDVTDDGEEGRGARTVAGHIIATSSPEYMRAWSKAFKTGVRSGQPDFEAMQVLQRAMSLTDGSGGYAVPLPIDPTLILADDGSVNPFRQISTVRTVVTDQLRTVNSTAVSFSFDAEAAEVSDDTTTFDVTDITVRMARGFIPFSIEVGMDYPGFTQDIAFLLADGKNNLEATVFATGAAGSNQPIGIVTALTGGAFEIDSNTTDVFALGDVYDLDEELPARFAQNASWVANKKIYQAIREAGGANLDDFWVNLGGGRPAELLGHPVYEASAMDGVIDALAANLVLILGDFRFYWIVDRVGFSMELVPHVFHTTSNRPSGQRGIFAFWRVGADSVNDRAFRMLDVT